MKIDNEEFGTLAVCAIRYCQGRQSYMPSTVRGIIRPYLSEISDRDLQVMINDCEYQADMSLWGDVNIDKQGWIDWKDMLIAEQKRRKK